MGHPFKNLAWQKDKNRKSLEPWRLRMKIFFDEGDGGFNDAHLYSGGNSPRFQFFPAMREGKAVAKAAIAKAATVWQRID